MKQVSRLLIILLMISCGRPAFKAGWANENAPAHFSARFETSRGNFDVAVTREWSPRAADRFYQLLNHRFYDNTLFYRVVPGFVVQFGNTDTTVTRHWSKIKVPDESVITGNQKGNLSFARAGKETRGNDLFINLNNNTILDTLKYGNVAGFPAFGMVTQGMDVVESIYSGYGDKTMDRPDTLYVNRSQFLSIFPKLDSIRKAYITGRK